MRVTRRTYNKHPYSTGLIAGALLLFTVTPAIASSKSDSLRSAFETVTVQTRESLMSALSLSKNGDLEAAATALDAAFSSLNNDTEALALDRTLVAFTSANIYRNASISAINVSLLSRKGGNSSEKKLANLSEQTLADWRRAFPLQKRLIDKTIEAYRLTCRSIPNDTSTLPDFYWNTLVDCGLALVGTEEDDLAVSALNRARENMPANSPTVAVANMLLDEAVRRGKSNLQRTNELLKDAQAVILESDAPVQATQAVTMMRSVNMAFPENADAYTHSQRKTQYSLAWSLIKESLPEAKVRLDRITGFITQDAINSGDFSQFDELAAPYLGEATSGAINLNRLHPADLLPVRNGFTGVDVVIRYNLDSQGEVTAAAVESCSDEQMDQVALIKQFMTTQHRPEVKNGRRVGKSDAHVTIRIEIFNTDGAGSQSVKYDWS